MMDEQRRYARGVEMLRDAEQWVVGGVKRMNLLDDPGHYPVFFSRAFGPHAWDVDGNRYVDLISGKGSVLLGYADPRVDGAVCAAIANGSMLPLTSDLYPRAARSVSTLMPSMERVKFLRAGSCAVSAAVRLSRVYTGRTRVLSCGYHGWHDWFIQERRPYPDTSRPVVDVHYDLAWIEALAEQFAGEIAAIVVTPEPTFFDPSFERAVADVARAIGAVFVLDEMKTGFRYGPHGYQAMAGLRPDLTTIGKAVANGYALAGVGGRREVMEAERETHISGTYETENVGLAAAIATTGLLAGEDYGALAALYARFTETVNDAFEARGIAARCASSAFNAQVVFESEETATAFYREAATQGVTFYCFDDVNLTFSHAPVFDELIDAIVRAVDSLPRGDAGATLTPGAVERYLRRHRVLSARTPQDDVVVAVYERVMAGAAAGPVAVTA